ncbi:hypothetical protein KUCAC02_018355 [Chaenocephalus aceratus]|uniref:Uncharacterized protein n=1 Tax=Chaenocephalus aceratus TaxID=36190 RepID=A0ACB9W876_CHAAC|nr:hypothetical protein KUCAC02_018355 [Chaenocephalus aceratus]
MTRSSRLACHSMVLLSPTTNPATSQAGVVSTGDSGGPLNCKGRDGKWYVQGVTSFVDGRGCNTPQKPTIFTRVASFIPWISETMAQN